MSRTTKKTNTLRRPRIDRLKDDFSWSIGVTLYAKGQKDPDFLKGYGTYDYDRITKETDPTWNDKNNPGRYTEWISRQFAHEPVKQEDLYKIREDLALVEQKKKERKLAGFDINKIKSLSELANLAMELGDVKFDDFETMFQNCPPEILKNTSVFYRGEAGLAITPHYREAAIWWSKGTRWCTGAKTSENTFFEYDIDGALVILSPAGTKNWFQGHVISSIMNEQDKEAQIDPSLQKLITALDRPWILKEQNPKKEEEHVHEQDEEEDDNFDKIDWSNKEQVLAAVIENGRNLQFAHEDLKKDRDIVLAAITEDGRALQYAHKDLKKDHKIVLAAVKEDGRALQYAHKNLKKVRKIVLVAVKEDGWALQYAHEDFKKDRKIVLAAVAEDGSALQFAHEDLKKEHDFVLAAVKKDGWALQYAHEDLKKDRKIVLAAVTKDGSALQYAHEDFKKEHKIVPAAVAENCESLQLAHIDLKNNFEFLKKCLFVNIRIIEFIPHEEWIKISQKEKRTAFYNSFHKNWGNIQYAADCGVELSVDEQFTQFKKAMEEESVALEKALHFFPALRPAWAAPKEQMTVAQARAVFDDLMAQEYDLEKNEAIQPTSP